MIPFRNVSPFKFFYTFQESKCPTLHKNLQYKGTEKKIKNDTYTVISHLYISLFQLQGRQIREDPNRRSAIKVTPGKHGKETT